MGSERRRHARVSLDCPVTISLPDGVFEARLRDLSPAGVCFFLDRRIAEMTVLEMVLPLPESGGRVTTIRGSGVVVRCQPLSPHVDHYEIAVFLNHVAEDDRGRLERYLRARAE